MTPTYFLEEATMPEIEDAIEGLEYAQRDGWLQTRLLISTQCDMDGKNLTDIMEFPWETEEPEMLKETTEKEFQELRRKAEALKQQIKL